MSPAPGPFPLVARVDRSVSARWPAFVLYSVATLFLVLLSPPAYFPLASFDRYLLADFPLFLALAAVLRDHPRARQIVLFTFAAVGAVAAIGYSRKVWIG